MKRALAGVGVIVAMELMIGALLGMVPPTKPIHWQVLGGMVGGPIAFAVVIFGSVWVLHKLGIDPPTDVPVGRHDAGATSPPALSDPTAEARASDDE